MGVAPYRLVALLSKLMVLVTVPLYLVFAMTVVVQAAPDPGKAEVDRLKNQSTQQQAMDYIQRSLVIAQSARGQAGKELILRKLASGSTSTCSATPYQVYSLASSPDNRHLISILSRFSFETGLFDYQIKQWNLVTGEEVPLSFEIATSLSDSSQGFTTYYFLNSVAFAPDGRTLVGAYYDNVYQNVIIKSWKLEAGTETCTLKIHLDSSITRLGSVQLSLDGNTLIQYDRDYFGLKTVTLWDLTSNRLIRTVQIPRIVDGVAISLDNQTVAIQKTDHAINVQNLSNDRVINEKPIQTVNQGSHNWNTLALSSDGKTLVVGNISGLIQTFNTATGELIYTLNLSNSSIDVPSLAISADNSTLFTSHKGELQQWDAVTGRLIRAFCIS